LVPVKGRWRSAAGEVNVGLAESNSSLLSGLWQSRLLRSDCQETGIRSGPIECESAFICWVGASLCHVYS